MVPRLMGTRLYPSTYSLVPLYPSLDTGQNRLYSALVVAMYPTSYTHVPMKDGEYYGHLAMLAARVEEMVANPPDVTGAELHAFNARLRHARMVLARAKGRHTQAQWDAILAEVAGICVRCGTHHDRLYKGHIVPLFKGGSDAADNLQPLCRFCVAGAANDGINWLAYWRETQTPAP